MNVLDVVYLIDFRLLLVENDIRKKLDLGSDMTKVHQALNIFARFFGWHWLLNEHRKEAGGLPLAEDV
ncbi:cyclic dof factor 2 [Prunus yedoensis var. nudiflora]|uniref:Cyclic dof factor 2 n=1 Tax=Prunus yedoensis var. nudiflora TaxID=2094558 RepID=A0A314Y304_PRUYE|nr:cyclic dof factor 2 [Prunus yedoensis var. nudiflora]